MVSTGPSSLSMILTISKGVRKKTEELPRSTGVVGRNHSGTERGKCLLDETTLGTGDCSKQGELCKSFLISFCWMRKYRIVSF